MLSVSTRCGCEYINEVIAILLAYLVTGMTAISYLARNSSRERSGSGIPRLLSVGIASQSNLRASGPVVSVRRHRRALGSAA